jgi:hypothetical protein
MNFGSFRVQVYIEDFMYQLIAKASSVVVLTSKLVMSSNILTHEKKQEKLVFLLRNNGNITFTFHAFDNVSLTHSRTIFRMTIKMTAIFLRFLT